MFETNGPGLRECIRNAWTFGHYRYFRHNLTCELRHMRYDDCLGYRGTWYDRFLFSLGVFLMDPLGRMHKRLCEHGYRFITPPAQVWGGDEQWLRHPLPHVRRRAKEYIHWLKGA